MLYEIDISDRDLIIYYEIDVLIKTLISDSLEELHSY